VPGVLANPAAEVGCVGEAELLGHLLDDCLRGEAFAGLGEEVEIAELVETHVERAAGQAVELGATETGSGFPFLKWEWPRLRSVPEGGEDEFQTGIAFASVGDPGSTLERLPEEGFHKRMEGGLGFEETGDVEQALPQGDITRPGAVFHGQTEVQGQGGKTGGRPAVAPDDRSCELQEGNSVLPGGREVDGGVDAPRFEFLKPLPSGGQQNPFSGADVVNFAFDFDGDMPFLQEPPRMEAVNDTGMIRLLEPAAI